MKKSVGIKILIDREIVCYLIFKQKQGKLRKFEVFCEAPLTLSTYCAIIYVELRNEP